MAAIRLRVSLDVLPRFLRPADLGRDLPGPDGGKPFRPLNATARPRNAAGRDGFRRGATSHKKSKLLLVNNFLIRKEENMREDLEEILEINKRLVDTHLRQKTNIC